MEELIVIGNPGMIEFSNFEKIKQQLTVFIEQNYSERDYNVLGYDAAKADKEVLKKLKKVFSEKRLALKKEHTSPFEQVEKMFKELEAIVDKAFKPADVFIKDNDKTVKKDKIMAYALEQSQRLGRHSEKIINSPSFFNAKWSNVSVSYKSVYAEIDQKIALAESDINTITALDSDNKKILLARYYETLSIEGLSEFNNAILEDEVETDNAFISNDAVDDTRIGYKILKTSGTLDQIRGLLNYMELQGIDYEELESDMPKAFNELTEPDFTNFVAFDLETTGTYGADRGDKEAKITEIGAVRVVAGQVVARFSELINPERKIVPRIERLTGISNEMLKDKPTIDVVLERFKQFIGNDILVGHNIKSSDLRYLESASKRTGIQIDNRYLDTYILAKKYKKNMHWESLKLEYLSEFFNFDHNAAHRAYSDAEVNVKLYFELKRMNEQNNY